MAALPSIRIDVVSDLACPWCYVGKRRLDKAMQAYSSRANFKLQWHPYMIDVATKSEGEEYMAYNRRRWGGDGWTVQLRQSGKPDGALFANWKTWPNTLQAHRLAWYADKAGKGHQAQEKLFERTYEQGGNISDSATLAQVAEQLQLQGAAAFLASEHGQDEVLAQDAAAKQRKVRGVPHFTIKPEGQTADGAHVLKGAQGVDGFLAAFAAIVGRGQ
ncbi:hypothetical protein WJX73_005482 [Symbiochloris irregularis]|uniref:DSBA-like thioredoxin domain-containing protein n=1 Tax=Symbiochloris irregularis TaxID=706552 RepID=A0AAW1NXL9_9CHLO